MTMKLTGVPPAEGQRESMKLPGGVPVGRTTVWNTTIVLIVEIFPRKLNVLIV